ncbi:MAG: hypothetical protein ACRERE_02750 [Candidatus Entotheonellia bacterium]
MNFDWLEVVYALVGALVGTGIGAYFGLTTATRVDRRRAIEGVTAEAIAAARVMAQAVIQAKMLNLQGCDAISAILPSSSQLIRADSIAGVVVGNRKDVLREKITKLNRLMHKVLVPSSDPMDDYNKIISPYLDNLEALLRKRY